MASTTSTAFSVWPIVGYALLAILLSYLGVRVVRLLKARRMTAATLPKPVSGAAAHKSRLGGFTFGRSTGWDWRRWTLPRVPSWPRVPEVVKGKARAVANVKNLSVELLPTTGLPPPPTPVPAPMTTPMPVLIPTPQLVDLSTPAPLEPPTPPLTTASTSMSFPNSPRTPSPAFHQQPQLNLATLSKPIYPTPAHPSYPRPPSPHALLATTPPPKQHRRSRSLGGVPVRRLSGGPSGLRNAVEMKDLSASAAHGHNQNHVRETSREHLLIDFSSGSDDEDKEEQVLKISPAASDIGVLPSGKEVLPLVGVGKHMPLVYLGDGEVASQAQEHEDGWKWFEKGTVTSLSYGYGGYGFNAAQPALVDSKPRSINKQLVSFPQIRAAQTERLVDVDNDSSHTELVSVSDSIHVRRLELEQNAISSQEETLVNLSDQKAGAQAPVSSYTSKEAPLADLHAHKEHAHVHSNLVDNEELQVLPILPLAPSPPPPPSHTPVFVKAAFSHPLEDLVHLATQLPVESPLLLVSEKESEKEATSELVGQPGSLFAKAQPQAEQVAEAQAAEPPSPLIIPMSDAEVDVENQASSQPQGGWAWDDVDVDDPWGNHVPMLAADTDTSNTSPSSLSSPDSDVFIYTGLDAVPASSQPEEQKQQQRGQGDDLIVFEAAGSSVQSTALETFLMRLESESEPEPDVEVLEKSPGGTLFATVLPDDDEQGVPPFDLDLEGGLGMEEPALEHDRPVDEEEAEEDVTPKPTPASVPLELPILPIDEDEVDTLEPAEQVQVPFIIVQDSPSISGPEAGTETESASTSEAYPDPDFLPLPESPSPSSLLMAVDEALVVRKEEGKEKVNIAPSQTPTPPASPPPISPFRFASNKSQPPSPGGGGVRSLRLVPSPRLAVVVPLPTTQAPVSLGDAEDKENETPTALSAGAGTKPLWAIKDAAEAPLLLSSPGVRRRVLVDVSAGGNGEDDKEKETVQPEEKEDQQEKHVFELKLSSSLPGSFPDATPSTLAPPSTSVSTTSSPTIAARLALAPNTLSRPPSARTLVRSPLDIALAMQLRPGLGAGADPAWMVRFLMAMFGWFAVAVSGGEHFR